MAGTYKDLSRGRKVTLNRDFNIDKFEKAKLTQFRVWFGFYLNLVLKLSLEHRFSFWESLPVN